MRIHQFQSLKQEVVTSWETICFYENRSLKRISFHNFSIKWTESNWKFWGYSITILSTKYFKITSWITCQLVLFHFALISCVSLRQEQYRIFHRQVSVRVILKIIKYAFRCVKLSANVYAPKYSTRLTEAYFSARKRLLLRRHKRLSGLS